MKRIQVVRLRGTMTRSGEEQLKGRLEEIKQNLLRPMVRLDHIKTQYSILKIHWDNREPSVAHKYNTVDANQLDNIVKASIRYVFNLMINEFETTFKPIFRFLALNTQE